MTNSKTPKNNVTGADYGNFKDPVGLLLRMLRSRNRAAYFTLFREGLSLMLTPLDILLASSEQKLTRKPAQSDLPLVLILGGSRSGTTLLYQTLCHYLPVSYFNNLSVSFPRSPITSSNMFKRFLKKGNSTFKNYYGSVPGFNGPNDGFHIWNRWLGQDRNHVDSDIDQVVLEEMRNFVHTWHATFGKPLLNKNNRNSLAISTFERALPTQVRYIVIKRHPQFVVQSLICSREEVQGDKRVGWGLGANETTSTDKHDKSDPYAYIEDICRQVYTVDKQLNQNLQQVDSNRYIEITYEEFCQNPQAVVQQVALLVLGKKLDDKELKNLNPFDNTNNQRLSDEEFQRIKETLKVLGRQNRAITTENPIC